MRGRALGPRGLSAFVEIVPPGHGRRVHTLAVTPDGSQLWITESDGRLIKVNTATFQEIGFPESPWTLVELSEAVAASRTVVSERFTDLVGIPPMQYLTQWRLQLAAEQLAGSSAKVAAIGARVGYESEAAFSRAFKRATGQSPAAWRWARQRDSSESVRQREAR